MTETARRPRGTVPDLAPLRANDPRAIAAALRDLLPLVRARMYRLLGATSDLDDAVQEALAEIAAFLPRFEGRAKLETAAHTIVVRVAYHYFGRAREVAIDSVPEPVGIDAESHVMAREALARLHRCLARLPAKRRVAFVLCAIEGMTPSEAARVAGTSALAMRSRLSRARRELARMLARDPYLGAWVTAEVAP